MQNLLQKNKTDSNTNFMLLKTQFIILNLKPILYLFIIGMNLNREMEKNKNLNRRH